MREDDFARERRRMVESQLRARGIRDERVLEAMATIPRERFVDEGSRPAAYDDGPLPIGHDQTISQPWFVAPMPELAAPGPADRVLEVGAGCGYLVAVPAQLAREAVGIERHPAVARRARDHLAALGLANAPIVIGDGGG